MQGCLFFSCHRARWSEIQGGFGYVFLPVDGNGDCLFTSFKMLAAAKGMKVEVNELRAVAADAYTQEEVQTLRGQFDKDETPEGKYIYRKLRSKGMKEDALFLEAFKEGASQSGA